MSQSPSSTGTGAGADTSAGTGGDPPTGIGGDQAPGSARAGASGAPPRKRRPVFSAGGRMRRLARLWGFLGFAILVLVLTRHVILPFVFALLVAYVLAPLVRRMSVRAGGGARMPRWVAIIVCYIVFLALLSSFVVLLLPRLSRDAARIARELPALYETVNEEWAPELAVWIKERFPADGDAAPAPAGRVEPGQAVYLPPDTAFVLTTLPDGRTAVELPPGGVALLPRPDGGFDLRSNEVPAESVVIEERIRLWTAQLAEGLQSRVGDLMRFGQSLVTGLVRSVFTFFLVLMVAAFILLDLEKLHGFARGLIPVGYRDDYDIIVQGINRGLDGVIRGQLLICLINGILTYVGLVIFDVEYSLILAVVAAIMSLIPIFGSILSTIPIVAAALVSGADGLDIARGLAILAWIIGIHMLEANILNPKIMGTAARIHPVLVIFALIVGEHGYGLVGALLAVPVTSMIQVLFEYFRNKAWKLEGEPAAAGQHDRSVPADSAALPGSS